MKPLLSIIIALSVLTGVGVRFATAASQPSKPMPGCSVAMGDKVARLPAGSPEKRG